MLRLLPGSTWRRESTGNSCAVRVHGDMSHPLRVQRKGMRAPLNGAVLVTRGTRWGNPFRIEEYGRAEALRRYEQEYLPSHPELLAQLPELRGKRLA